MQSNGQPFNSPVFAWYSGLLILVGSFPLCKFKKSHILQKPHTLKNYQNFQTQFPANLSGIYGENVQT